MIKSRTPNGYVFYVFTADITWGLGGAGICDICGKFTNAGALAAVTNSYMCPNCFQKLSLGKSIHPMDAEIEARNENYYDGMFTEITEIPFEDAQRIILKLNATLAEKTTTEREDA